MIGPERQIPDFANKVPAGPTPGEMAIIISNELWDDPIGHVALRLETQQPAVIIRLSPREK